MTTLTLIRQRGVALPVMLIMLVVMLLGSLYLMKASHNSSLVTANLAYDSSLSKAVDLGLLTGANWLSVTAAANKPLLDADSLVNGYLSTFDPTVPVSNETFWANYVSVDDTAGNSIQYVIHRMCQATGRYDSGSNACVQTTDNTGKTGSVQLGESLASDSQPVAHPPKVHYVITARIFGPRGGNVVNQMVVMIGA